MAFTFWTGTHMPHWLGERSPLPEPIPLCVARGRLAGRKTMPVARAPFILDSGGYGELAPDPNDPDATRSGPTDWDVTARQFVAQIRRIVDEVGNVAWCAPMDWMCEPHVIAATGLTAVEHQRRTVESAVELRSIAPELPIKLVIQGDPADPDSHLRCIDLYERAGFDFTQEDVVGVGSVCRLQSTRKIVDLIAAVYRRLEGSGAGLHGFGMSIDGMQCAQGLVSSDSMAWSYAGTKMGPCIHGSPAKSEANCPVWALQWRAKVLAAAAKSTPARWAKTVAAHAARGHQGTLYDTVPPVPGWMAHGELMAQLVAEYEPQLYSADGPWRFAVGTRKGGELVELASASGEGGGLAALLNAARYAFSQANAMGDVDSAR